MARPPHPNSHDVLTKQILEQAMTEEVLVPCPDKATALLVRGRLYALVRAYKDWNLPEYNTFRHLKTKLLTTGAVLTRRANYLADPTDKPFTLVLDSRDGAAAAMEEALGTGSSVPMTRKPEIGHSTFDDFDDEDEETDPNAYAKILERMNDA